jgi:hypothetical protein
VSVVEIKEDLNILELLITYFRSGSGGGKEFLYLFASNIGTYRNSRHFLSKPLQDIGVANKVKTGHILDELMSYGSGPMM